MINARLGFLLAALLTGAEMVSAAEIELPNALVNGEVADADAVNENFNVVIAESNAQDGRLSILEAQTLSVQTLTAPQTIINNTAGAIQTPACPLGMVAIGGGASMDPLTSNPPGGGFLIFPFPYPPDDRLWAYNFRNTTGGEQNVISYTKCIGLGAPEN